MFDKFKQKASPLKLLSQMNRNLASMECPLLISSFRFDWLTTIVAANENYCFWLADF